MKLSATPKVQTVIYHVAQSGKRSNNGHGFRSEQAMKSVHYDVQMTWNKYIVFSTNAGYGKQLLKAVQGYNSVQV